MTQPGTVPDLLAARARADAERLFVDVGGERRTFAQLHSRAERIAAGLAQLGVGARDRVASILGNSIEHVELICATARLGAIHVPTNVFLKGEFLRYQLDDAAARVVVADEDGMRAVDAVRGDLPGLEHVIASDELPVDDRTVPEPELSPSDTVAIMYTSGTTGLPKGCMLPHGYHAIAPAQANTLLAYSSKDVCYTSLPLFHGWARGMLFGGLVHGFTVVLDEAFSPSHALERMLSCGATVFSGVGAMGMALLALPPSDLDRSHGLRCAFMIPFAPSDEAAFTERFGVRVQSNMYGQTETGAITYTPLSEAAKPGTIGRASPQYDVRIVDDIDRDVADGETGEVVVRPRIADVMYTGYWRKPAETAEAMRGGWHHTGDLASRDGDGYLTFVDRKKDAVRRRGENVSSVQLEAAIATHPKISEAAVVAVPSDMTEDEIKVCIVTSAPVTPDELFAFFRERLPYFAIPRYVEVVDALPKTATMRVQKHVLRRACITPRTWDLEALGLVVPRDRRRS